ncbi:MAG: hypothetical protein C4536_14595 [Actinobacteria bacterium]|nr:MAG: hypothetical protein C4536_14595 [Actinomycetota bacterium]
MERCGDCGIPLMISRELAWNENGVITLTGSPRSRMVLYESRVIDNLFKGVEELIGVPIEHIVIESRRREVKGYIEKRFPAEMKQLFNYRDEEPSGDGDGGGLENSGLVLARDVMMQVIDIGRIYGYGASAPGGRWESGERYPWRSNVIRHPYSVPFWAAEALGSVEALEGVEQWVRYEKTEEDTYVVTTYPAGHPIELKERLQRKRYDFKPGDITYERCPSCGLPVDLARYDWRPEEGTITDPDFGRRMAIYGPSALEVVLDDLEAELGESIPEVVVEAQRRYVKSRVSEQNWRRGGGTFNHLTALRGFGNITAFEADEHNLKLTIENSCLHLILVGMAQALYELALNKDSSEYEWSLTSDGDLAIAVRG